MSKREKRIPFTKKPKKRLRYRLWNGLPALSPAELLLEHLSQDNLSQWKERGAKIETYHARLFYELEAQRAANQSKITAALQKIDGISLDLSGWCRGIKFKYSNAPLSCVGSLKESGRFNYAADIDPSRFPPFPALYVASNPETAYCEMFSIMANEPIKGLTGAAFALQRDTSFVVLALTGIVHNVFDLNETNLIPFLEVTSAFTLSKEIQKLGRDLGVSMGVAKAPEDLLATFMDPHWRAFPTQADIPANGQVLGQLVSRAGFDGIRYKSVKTGADAVVIFTRNLKNSASVIRVNDPPPNCNCGELNANTFADAERNYWE